MFRGPGIENFHILKSSSASSLGNGVNSSICHGEMLFAVEAVVFRRAAVDDVEGVSLEWVISALYRIWAAVK